MPKRSLALFLLCFGVVALSGAFVLVTADSWLHEPGAQVFGNIRTLSLMWTMVLLEAPVLAAVSAHFLGVSAGFAGTVAGAAAVTLASDLLQYGQSFDVGAFLFVLFFAAGVVGLPVLVEFSIVVTLRRMKQRRPDQVAGIIVGLMAGLAVTLMRVWFHTDPVEGFVSGCILGVVVYAAVVVVRGRIRRYGRPDDPDAPTVTRVHEADTEHDARRDVSLEAPEMAERGYVATSTSWTARSAPTARAVVVRGALTILAALLPLWWALDFAAHNPNDDALAFILPFCLIPAVVLGIAAIIAADRAAGRESGRLEVTWTKVNDAPAPG